MRALNLTRKAQVGGVIVSDIFMADMYFFSVCPIFSFFSNFEWTRIGYFNRPGIALTPFPSSVVWDEIRTHNLLIINLVSYPLDQNFALNYICLFQLATDNFNHSNTGFTLVYYYDTFAIEEVSTILEHN